MVTPLLCIDTAKNRVRKYEARRSGARVHLKEEVYIVRPQCHTLEQQLNALLAGRPLEYAEAPPEAA